MATTTYQIQLMDRATGKAIIAAGGTAYIVTAGGTAKKTLLNASTGASLANPFTPTRGSIAFTIASITPLESTVDAYIMCPGGQFVVARSIKAGNPTEVWVDTFNREQVLIQPFDIADTTAATATDVGFDFVAGMIIKPEASIFVTAVDATETMDVGLKAAESGGDADGFLAQVSVATLGAVLGLCATTATLGALLRETVTDSGSATSSVRAPYVVAAAVSLSYTLSTGTDTAAGFIQIPYRIGANAA